MGRLNRYYREKESAELEVDTLRARVSMTGGYERGLRRYRRSAQAKTGLVARVTGDCGK